MNLVLIIDLENSAAAVRQGKRRVLAIEDEQWLQFFVRLAFAQKYADRWVTSDALAELAQWKRIKKDNIGKIVAREIDKRPALSRCVSTDKKTVHWRLPPNMNVEVLPDEIYLRNWLTDRGMGRPALAVSSPWLPHIVRAQIAFHRGDAKKAAALAGSARESAVDDQSLRLSALLYVRAEDLRGRLQQARKQMEVFLAGKRGLLEPTQDSLWGSDSFGLHCRARLAVMEARGSHVLDSKTHKANLLRAMQRADMGSDLARQAVVSNALGILACRNEQFDDARSWLNETIPTALAVNDLFTLGGAIFNLALADLLDQRVNVGRVDPSFAHQLLTLCAELDAEVVVGQSSAQAEILQARLLIGARRFAEAEQMMDVAQAMVRRTGNPYDDGCLLLARAELAWGRTVGDESDRQSGKQSAERFLVAAQERFELTESGGWHYADDQLTSLRMGKGIALPWQTD
jgi:hypothetical protein